MKKTTQQPDELRDGKPYITGYYGCKCHPFRNWQQCDKAHRRKFKDGQPVRNRCTGLEGHILHYEGTPGFYIVKYGPLARDQHLEHAAELTDPVGQMKLFNASIL